jgi:AcrR family transcriptional regulator
VFKNEPTTKRERTRARIRDVALRSLRERGYEETTMRSIADEAGLSVGNAYYHFPTKDHLVQELYVEVQEAHREAVRRPLRETDDLVERVGIVLRTGIDGLGEYHRIASQFLASAVAPGSPINPMSPDSTEAREIVLGVFRDAVGGARQRLPRDLADDLPGVLWYAYLLLVLFWVYDTSPGQTRTRKLLGAGLGLFRIALPMLRVRPFRAAATEIVGLVTGRLS